MKGAGLPYKASLILLALILFLCVLLVNLLLDVHYYLAFVLAAVGAHDVLPFGLPTILAKHDSG